jgi:DUF177 domain-containing protein
VLTHDFDLAGLRLQAGEGRRLQLSVPLAAAILGGERYQPEPASAAVRLDVSRMMGDGYALRLSFEARLRGSCMRCLKPAAPKMTVEAREVDAPGGGEDLDSPYVENGVLDLASWARDALLLSAPVAVLCREDCLGLCPVCAADLNEAGEGHAHERGEDPRWAKLRELKLD